MSYIEFELDGSSFVTVPESGGSFNVVVIFGGMHFATPRWMQKQTPQEIMENALVVFAPYTVAYETVIKSLGSFLGAQKLKATGQANASILGFSAGGYRALDAYSPSFKFIGLIDPSFRRSHRKRTYSRNVAMLWGSTDQVATFTEAGFVELEASVQASGGFSERLNLAHPDFPKVFLERFKGRV